MSSTSPARARAGGDRRDRRARRLGGGGGDHVRAARPSPAAVGVRPDRAARRRQRGDRRPDPSRDGRRNQLRAVPRRGPLGRGRSIPRPAPPATAPDRRAGPATSSATSRAQSPASSATGWRTGPRPPDRRRARARLHRRALDELKRDRRLAAPARDRQRRPARRRSRAVCGLARRRRRAAAGLRAQVPVSLHHRDETADELSTATRSSTSTCRSPRRTRWGGSTRSAPRPRSESASATPRSSTTSSTRSPACQPLDRVVARVATGPHEFSLSISNVPGPARRARDLPGGAVERLRSVAEPADRHALRVSAISCSGTVGIGLCTDPEASPGSPTWRTRSTRRSTSWTRRRLVPTDSVSARWRRS